MRGSFTGAGRCRIALDVVRRHVLGLPPHEAELFRRR